MLQITKSLWNDEAGFVISAELALVTTLCVMGLVVGLSAVRDAVNCELTDVSSAICSLDQSYYYTGFHSRKWPGCCTTKAWTAGSAFIQGNKGCTDCVDFVTTSNVAPCQTCTTGAAVITTPTPVASPTPAVVPAPAPVRIIEQPKVEAAPCPVPAVPAPTSSVCPPPAPVVNITCPQPVSLVIPSPSNGCAVPATCPGSTGSACGTAIPAGRSVIVPQTQPFNW